MLLVGESKDGQRGVLHDDTWCTAFGDLLYRFPIVGILDSVQDVILIREATSLKLGEDQLPVDFNLKAATSSHEAGQIRIGKLTPDNPGELLIAGFVSSCSTVFDFNRHPHRSSSCCCWCSSVTSPQCALTRLQLV